MDWLSRLGSIVAKRTTPCVFQYFRCEGTYRGSMRGSIFYYQADDDYIMGCTCPGTARQASGPSIPARRGAGVE